MTCLGPGQVIFDHPLDSSLATRSSAEIFTMATNNRGGEG
jgi:hypothetical protein